MKPRGRPPLDRTTPSEGVYVTLPARDYHRAAHLAKVERTTIQAVIRLGLKRLLDPTGNKPS